MTSLTSEDPAPSLSRRTIITSAAWSVPVVVAVTATPAFAAASGQTSITATTPNMQTPAGGTSTVTAVVKDGTGKPLAGQAVSFTGPSGTSFSPTTATTNGSGVATSTLTVSDSWTTAGTTITATATSNGVSGTAALTVLGANAYALGQNTGGLAGTGSSATQVSPAAQLTRAFPSPVVSLSAAATFSLALLKDGTVWAVGNNDSGQLGDGTNTSRTTWAPVPDLTGVKQIVAAGSSGYALLSDGSVKAWGLNTGSQLGDGSSTNRNVPVSVSGITSATQIAASATNGMACLSDGTVNIWGDNSHGQFGNGTTSSSNYPQTASVITDAVEVATIEGSCYARSSSGTIYSWGSNSNGAMGTGLPLANITRPGRVSGITTATQISAGRFNPYALLSDGTIRSWGRGADNALGNGSTNNATTPVTVSGITTAVQVVGGNRTAWALLKDGTIKAWGSANTSDSTYGQLGDPNTTTAPTPITVNGTSRVTQLAGSSSASTLFLIVGDPVVTVSANPTIVAAGATSTITGHANGAAYGSVMSGQPISFSASADPSATVSVSPASATTDSSGNATSTLTVSDSWTTAGTTITATATSNGVSGTAALTVLGANAYALGQNTGGLAGTGSSATQVSPAAQLTRAFPSPVVSLSAAATFSLALLKDGTVWAVGNNDSGQLGDGTNTSRTTWAPVPDLTGVKQIVAAGSSGYALLSDGSVKAWGLNTGSQLGDGSSTNRNVPVSVSGITSATQIAASATNGMACLSDGTVNIWGDNSHGQFGNGTTSSSNYPQTASVITDAVEVATIEGSCYARSSSGTIYSWGSNSNGAMGTGLPLANITRPGRVSGITTATQISAGRFNPYALLSDGTIRSWGRGADNALGNGSTNNATTPVTVSGITTAVQVVGGNRTAWALLKDGTIKAWGSANTSDSTYGQLGDPNTTTAPTPITVNGTSRVTQLAGSSSASTLFLITG
ncbi:Ig-like domain-containing protein [Microbacterium sp. BWR-S6Y]|uniref:hypothetical protein n=1 Tax=Microbacterium sp. BWR-S6Y TaxID=3232073 RepID=UPI003527789A